MKTSASLAGFCIREEIIVSCLGTPPSVDLNLNFIISIECASCTLSSSHVISSTLEVQPLDRIQRHPLSSTSRDAPGLLLNSQPHLPIHGKPNVKNHYMMVDLTERLFP
ncbi:unnamed protein product [Cuscuta campestris]|uniref:Uncharacterized protein n=1 Tax=Cuscuta campestris TaxID=132261 RepID=A0A484MSK4_9ASTE|nr:unnamed protein product [Cuscuta campestris]